MENKNLKVNSILSVIKTLANILFPLITFPYVNNVLTPTNVGKVQFASYFITYFSLIATLGITTYAIRECSAARSDKTKLSKKASEIYSINICTTVIAYACLAITLLLFRRLDSYRNLILIQSCTIFFLTWGADWLNSAMEDLKYIAIRTVAFQSVALIMTFVFVQNENDYFKYAIILVVSSSGANFMNVFYRRKYCKVRFTFDMHIKEHLTPILLLFVMLLAQTIFSSADVTMLGLIKGDYEVGIYSTAVKLQTTIAQVVSSLAWVVMPRLSVYFAEENFDKINDLLEKILNVLVIIGLPSVFGVFAISDEIVAIVGGGSKFADASLPLAILMISFGLSLVGGSFLGNMVLLPSKREKTYMIICIVATLANVILNAFLIPIGGAIAASATTAFSALIILVMLLITKDKRIKLNYLGRVFLSPAVGSVVIYVYCILVRQYFKSIWYSTSICIIGSMVLYLGILIIMKNRMCLSVLNSLKKKLSSINISK